MFEFCHLSARPGPDRIFAATRFICDACRTDCSSTDRRGTDRELCTSCDDMLASIAGYTWNDWLGRYVESYFTPSWATVKTLADAPADVRYDEDGAHDTPDAFRAHREYLARESRSVCLDNLTPIQRTLLIIASHRACGGGDELPDSVHGALGVRMHGYDAWNADAVYTPYYAIPLHTALEHPAFHELCEVVTVGEFTAALCI